MKILFPKQNKTGYREFIKQIKCLNYNNIYSYNNLNKNKKIQKHQF